MRERVPESAQSARATEHKDGHGRLSHGKSTPPLLQALTLSTKFAGAEKLRPRTPASTKPSDVDQGFGMRALQIIKASHTASAGSTGQSLRRFPDASSARTAIHTPQHFKADGNARQPQSQDIKAWRHSRVLQDAGLKVTAVKVNRRQCLDLAQVTSGQSPYSGKSGDEDAPTKRKSVVRSASFASGSSEAAARRGHSTISATPGFRPGSAPPSGAGALTSSALGKQPLKRRQLAEPQSTSSLPAYTLLDFRAGSCLSVNSQLGKSKQGPRPGTPSIRAEAANVSAASQSDSPALQAFGKLHKPTSAPVQQVLAVSTSSAAAAAYKTAAAVGYKPAVTAVTNSGGNVDVIRADSRPGAKSNDLSDSDDSSWSLLDSDSSLESCSNVAADCKQRHQHSRSQKVDTPGLVSRRCLQITEALQQFSSNAKNRGAGHTEQTQTGYRIHKPSSLLSRQAHAGSETHSHIDGNTLVCCVSSRGQEPCAAVQHCFQDPLLQQSTEVMCWLGMDAKWFEETFLPLAENTL